MKLPFFSEAVKVSYEIVQNKKKGTDIDESKVKMLDKDLDPNESPIITAPSSPRIENSNDVKSKSSLKNKLTKKIIQKVSMQS